MKLAIPIITPPANTVVSHNKRSIENFFIALIAIIGTITQVLVFMMHKLAYEDESPALGFSLLLWVAVISPVMFTAIIIRLHRKAGQNNGRMKNDVKKRILHLESKALRAQMNPHFIFNCMNSIKQLIQQKEENKAIAYLTAFSKLMRAILQHSDRKEITLFEEIETCCLYTQLESMRFSNAFSYAFDIDETLDLKSVMVPALIVQPFIENAIWHGIMPKAGEGRLTVTIKKTAHAIQCIIDDNGIGRQLAMENRCSNAHSTHVSKGIGLTKSRLELSNILNQRDAQVSIIDKKNTAGKPEGTTVVLVFNEE